MTDPRTLVLIGDVHGEEERLARVLDRLRPLHAALALLAGDIGVDPPWHRAQRRTHRARHDDSVRRVLARVVETLGCPVVFVPGNHDLADPPADARAVNADRRIVEVAGLRIAGFGGAGPAQFGFPYEWSEDEAERALEPLLAGPLPVDIWLSHTPPLGTALDRTATGESVGSAAVRRWIPRLRPRLFACGHIHESAGVERLDGVPCVNAGALGAPFARDLAWLVEWSGGPQAITPCGPAPPV